MMKSIQGAAGKSSKQPLKCGQLVVLAVMVFFVVGELFLAKHLAVNSTTLTSCPEPGPISRFPRGDQAASIPILTHSPTVHEAFGPENVVQWDDITERAPKGLRTSIDTSDPVDVRFLRYGMSPVKNICLHPSGKIVVVGLSESEFNRSLAGAGEAMVKAWTETYTCESRCRGVAFENRMPENAAWVTVTTTHIVPYVGNIIHHFGEKVWPLLTGFDLRPRQKRPRQAYYYVHRMHNWLEQAHQNVERNTFMFQTALLSRMAPPGTIKFLQHRDGETRPLCFQTLMLAHDAPSSGRMNPQLGVANFAPAMARYRHAAFEYFGVPNPQVSLPPHPLRVTLYGRRDASRRRITNIDEVGHYLRTSMQPGPLVVTSVDDLIEQGAYNQSLPQVVSLMAQTDVLITAHGASTWETIFMPEGSAVLEVHGPCGPGTWLSNTIVPGLRLKFRNQRMWGERVPEPRAGNTTECISHRETPNYTIDIEKLRNEIESLRAVDGPGDRLPLHWLFDWSRNSY